MRLLKKYYVNNIMNKKKLKFNRSVVGVRGYSLYLEFSKYIKDIDLNYFLKNYKISNIWWGKWIIKRLISKIFRKRIFSKIKWANSFWNKIEVFLVKTKIEKKSYSKIDIENKIKVETKINRFNDIKKYQRLFKTGKKLPPPLYISGRCLNYLGANVDGELLFILDGSRRLTAHILNKNSPNIIIIDLKN